LQQLEAVIVCTIGISRVERRVSRNSDPRRHIIGKENPQVLSRVYGIVALLIVELEGRVAALRRDREVDHIIATWVIAGERIAGQVGKAQWVR